MSTPRSTSTSNNYKNLIYCIGGFNNNALSTNEVYHCDTDTWETKTDIPISVRFFGSCLYKHKIYCAGGVNVSNYNLNQVYNIDTDTWESKTAMGTLRTQMSSTILNNKIYCIGGTASQSYITKTNEIYNCDTDTWSIGLDFPVLIKLESLTVYDGKIYSIGGFDNSTRLKINNRYTPKEISYNVELPSNIGDKLTSITDTGNGTRVLSDSGEYVDIPKGYRFLSDDEINEIINNIKTLTNGGNE